MINHDVIEKKFLEIPQVHLVKVEGDGYHYQLTVVSDLFVGKNKVARQQWVYGLLKEFIATGELHALSMQTWTTDEWGAQHG